MRMWMIPPRLLCRNHLLGEHKEIHMLIGCIKKEKKLNGYLEKRIIELESIPIRHITLIYEMLNRGYHHYSPIPTLFEYEIDNYPYYGKVDLNVSINDLMSRCTKCKEKIEPELSYLNLK